MKDLLKKITMFSVSVSLVLSNCFFASAEAKSIVEEVEVEVDGVNYEISIIDSGDTMTITLKTDDSKDYKVESVDLVDLTVVDKSYEYDGKGFFGNDKYSCKTTKYDFGDMEFEAVSGQAIQWNANYWGRCPFGPATSLYYRTGYDSATQKSFVEVGKLKSSTNQITMTGLSSSKKDMVNRYMNDLNQSNLYAASAYAKSHLAVATDAVLLTAVLASLISLPTSAIVTTLTAVFKGASKSTLTTVIDEYKVSYSYALDANNIFPTLLTY